MKRLIQIIIVVSLLFPLVSFAKDLSLLHIVLAKDIEEVCWGKIPSEGMIIGGCFLPGTNIIFINYYANPKYYGYILFHEIGHWLTDEENFSNDESELIADKFAYWILGKPTAQKDIDYFIKLLII